MRWQSWRVSFARIFKALFFKVGWFAFLFFDVKIIIRRFDWFSFRNLFFETLIFNWGFNFWSIYRNWNKIIDSSKGEGSSLVNNYRVALCNIHWEKGGEIIKRHKIRSRRYPSVYPREDPLKIRWIRSILERFEMIETFFNEWCFQE